MKVLRLIIFISFIPALILLVGPGTTGCSGGGGGGESAAQMETAESTIAAVTIGMKMPLDEELQETYSELPDDMLTLYDVIEKDRLAGLLSPADAFIEQLFYYYSHPCLFDMYKQRTDVYVPESATRDLPMLYAMFARLSEEDQSRVLAVWEAIIEGTLPPLCGQPATAVEAPAAAGDQAAIDAAQTAVDAAQATFDNVLKAAEEAAMSGDPAAAQAAVAAAQEALQRALQDLQNAQQAAAAVGKSVVTVGKAAPGGSRPSLARPVVIELGDGSCIGVRNEDPTKSVLNQMAWRMPFSADGVNFEIFSDAGSTDVAEKVLSAFTSQGFVGKTRSAFSVPDPKPYDADSSCVCASGEKCNPNKAYRIFVTSAGGRGEHAYVMPSQVATLPRSSYMVVLAPNMRPCSQSRFLRDVRECIGTLQEKINAGCGHEYYHVASLGISFEKEACEEAMATWAEESFTRSPTSAVKLWGHLYDGRDNVCSWAWSKSYGSALFFWWLEDNGGISAVKKYFKAIHDGGYYLEALKTATSGVGGLEKAFHDFVLAGLNLKDSPAAPSFSVKHPHYQDTYLTDGEYVLVADYPGVYRVRIKVDRLGHLKFQTVAIASAYAKMWNRYFKFTPSWGGKASVFMIKVDPQGQNNFKEYKVTKFFNSIPSEYCVKTMDEAPDMLLFVFSNATEELLSGTLTIESRPFCEPVPVTVRASLSLNAHDSSGYSHTMDPGANFLQLDATVDSKWSGSWQGVNQSRREHLEAIVEYPAAFPGAGGGTTWSTEPAKITWAHNETKKIPESAPPIVCLETCITTGSGTVTLSQADDLVSFDVSPWGDIPNNVPPGTYRISTKWSADELVLKEALKTGCTGCPWSQNGTANADISVPEIAWFYTNGATSYADGATTITGSYQETSADRETPTVTYTWTVKAQEPMATFKGTPGFIIYDPSSGATIPPKLKYQLIPPVLDNNKLRERETEKVWGPLQDRGLK